MAYIDVHNKYLNSLEKIELNGSSKQKEWASQIRYKATLWINYAHDDAYMQHFISFLREYTAASWWIEHRDDFYYIRHMYELFSEEMKL